MNAHKLSSEVAALEPGSSLNFINVNGGGWRIIRHSGGGLIGHSLYEGIYTIREGDTLTEALEAEERPYER